MTQLSNIKNYNNQPPSTTKIDVENITSVYFIGIGGIGMSALARYFVTKAKAVAGYDKTPSKITAALADIGVHIHFEDNIDLLPTSFLDQQKTLVVYTPAVPKLHQELNYFKTSGYTVLKRSEVLGIITHSTFCLAVSGTHGKTTTSSILAHLLYESNAKISAFLGGISNNYNSNFIQNGTEITVVEADEFDRSFLTLHPDYACITSIDADHLDIYGDKKSLEDTFITFSNQIKPNGKLFVKYGLPIEGITYGFEEDSDFKILNQNISNGFYIFDIKTPNEIIKNVQFNLPGHHNLMNALVAFAMAYTNGCDVRQLKKALKNYKGVKRRFSYELNSEAQVYIDDYAHHPREISAVHQALRELYPGDEVLAIFQPHLYSRTNDFAQEFGVELSKFDALILLDIYPAREEPIKGVTSSWLLKQVDLKHKILCTKENLISQIKKYQKRIIVTMGAGDIATEVEKIKKALINK